MQPEPAYSTHRSIPQPPPRLAAKVAAAMAFIPAVALIVFFIISPHIELYLTNSVVVFSGLGLFMLAGLLAEDVEQDATIAYLNFSAIVTWLALGVAPALTVIIVGVALTAVLRQTLASSLNLRERTFIEIRNLALRRVAATGNAILLAAGGYALLDGMMPLKTLDADDVTALIVALPIAFVSIKLVEFFLPLEDTRTPSLWDWSHQQRGRLVVEIFLLPTSVALSLVVHNAPPGVFAVIMILLGLQALRQNQVSQSQQLLHQRVQELSLLTTLGQRLSRSLLLEDLIQSLHIQITTIMPSSATVLVVYDVRAELPDYHAMFGQTNAKWTGKKAVVGPVLRTVRQRTLQYVKPVVPEELQAEGFDLSHFKGELTFIGVPLLVEDGAAIGAIGVIIDERRPDVRPEQLEWLQGISAQTANAVQNAINYAQTTLLAEHLALINRTVQSVLFNLDREDAIDIACKSIQQIANTQKVAVSTIDVEEQRLALEKVVGLTPAHRALIEQRSLEYAVATTTTRVIHNIGDVKDEPALLEQARIGAFQACVIIPLQSGDMVVGLVEVYHDDPQHYTPTIINLLETLASLIAAMLDNTRLFQALETYAFEMTQLANLSRTATSTLQLDLVVDDIAQVFGQLINVNRVVVARLMPNNQRFKLFGIANNDVTSDGEANQVGDSYLPDLPELRVFLQDSFPELLIFHSSDQNCSAALRAFMDENQERSLAFVPIIIEQTVLGVVLLGTHEERRFMPREWHLIEAATNQIAAHVHNTLLFERTQRDLDQRLEELSLIENIARQISGELNVSQIITNVLDAAMRSTGADMAGLAMLTEANEFLVISRRTEKEMTHHALDFSGIEQGIIGRVFREERVIIVADNQAEANYVAPDDESYRSSMAIPLYREDYVVGVLNVESREANFFREEQAGFLSSLGDHAVISMENARLLAERQHRIEMLTRLRDLTLRLSSTTHSQEVATTVLETALNLVDGASGGLYRYDLESGNMALLATASRQQNGYVQNGEVVDIAKAAALNGTFQQGYSLIHSDDHDAMQKCSVVAVPIKKQNDVSEVFIIVFNDERQIQPRELNTLELLASQAAGHLENAMLHERIRAGNDRMRAILDSTRDGVILLDQAGRLVESNPSAERLLGIDLEDYTGSYLWRLLLDQTRNDSPNDSSHDGLRNWARDLRLGPEGITHHEFTRFLPDSKVHLQVVGSPVWNSEKEVVGRLLTLRDITEAKELEAYREGLMHMVVHDLRNPLSSIISMLSLIEQTIPYPEELQSLQIMVENTTKRAEDLHEMVGMILDIYKYEQKNYELKLKEVQVDNLITDAVQTLEGLFQEAAINVQIEIPDSLPKLYIDYANIKRVLVNILGNAYKYTPHNSTVCVHVSPMPNKSQLKIRIVDSGPGIPPEQRRRIFELFEQIEDQTAKRGGKGTGIGLAFCKQAVEAHGGRIWVDDDGCLPGACFAFTLPTVVPH